jgi:hypothetical protein
MNGMTVISFVNTNVYDAFWQFLHKICKLLWFSYKIYLKFFSFATNDTVKSKHAWQAWVVFGILFYPSP